MRLVSIRFALFVVLIACGPERDDAGADSTNAGTESSGSESGDVVADCSECDPDEGCVFGELGTILCVAIPESCEDGELTCACASEYCEEPHLSCGDLPDSPRPAIGCACPAC